MNTTGRLAGCDGVFIDIQQHLMLARNFRRVRSTLKVVAMYIYICVWLFVSECVCMCSCVCVNLLAVV